MADLVVNLLGGAVELLWLLLPVHAVVSIRRRRRNRPGASCRFAYGVIVGWGLSLIALALDILRNGIYGEDGPPELFVVLLFAMLLAALVMLHRALLALGSVLPEGGDQVQ